MWLPADLLALMLGVSKRTVHRWAKADGWRTRGRWHDVEYFVDDAERSRDTRGRPVPGDAHNLLR